MAMNKEQNNILYGFLGTAGFIFSVVMLFGIFGSNNYENYQIKQAAITGKMTVINKAGMYFKMFGSIYTYPKAEDVDFQAYNTEVRFNDGSVAKVMGTIKFKLPTNEEKQLALHRDSANYNNVANDLIAKNVKESLSQTATMMSAEESYSTRRGEFASLSEQQVKLGIFETKSSEIDAVDPVNGTRFKKRIVELVYDKDGYPKVRKPSLLKEYDIEILQFIVNDFTYDKTIEKLIADKKEAEQEKVVAAANAEKAKQNAETEKQKGIAAVATANAQAQVEKIKAVVEAEKKAEMAKQEAIQAEFEAKAIIARGEAEATKARLLVQAGLSPKDKALIEKDTRIAVAQALANVKFPSTMIIAGGDGKGGGVNQFDAVGLKALYELSDKIAIK